MDKSLNILFLGDIVGRSGRDAVAKYLPQLKEQLKPDLVLANGENAAGLCLLLAACNPGRTNYYGPRE